MYIILYQKYNKLKIYLQLKMKINFNEDDKII